MHTHNRMYLLIFTLLLVLFVTGCPTSPENQNNEIVPQSIHRGDLIISRLYIGDGGNNKFFTITNTSDRDIDLSKVKIVFTPEVSKLDKIIDLPGTILASGKSIYCLNGFSSKKDWSSFKTINDLPEIPENGPYNKISTDSVWYGIEGRYVNNKISIMADNGKDNKLNTIDTSVSMSRPCAYLRYYDSAKNRDMGWYTLTWNSSSDKEDIQSGKHAGFPDRGPVARIPDMPLSGENTNPEQDENDLAPSYPGQTILKDNTALGTPKYVGTTGPSGDENFIVSKTSHVIGYNNTTHNPNWVSWHFTSKDKKGSRDFTPESLLPSAWKKIVHEDYEACAPKYNRGHMCPNGDRTGMPKNETYTMANVIPQDKDVNSGIWAQYENYLRAEAGKGNEYFTVSGPSIESDGEFIGTRSKQKIQIPSFAWRVAIIVNEADEDDLKRINDGNTSKLDAIAVWMPNDIDKVSSNWKDYIVSIDFVEKKTGLDFFADLTDDIETKLESKNSGSKAEIKYK